MDDIKPKPNQATPEEDSSQKETPSDEENAMQEENITTISWRALEYPHLEKGTRWYGILALVAAGLVIAAFATGDVILAILVLFGAATIGILGARKPEEIAISINGTTLHAGKEITYNLEEMKSFWIHYEPPDHPELLLHSSHTFTPLVSILLGEQDPVELRRYLRELLPEEKEEIPLTRRIAHMLRF